MTEHALVSLPAAMEVVNTLRPYVAEAALGRFTARGDGEGMLIQQWRYKATLPDFTLIKASEVLQVFDALTTATARLAERDERLREVTAEWESCLERDRAHWPAMQDMQAAHRELTARLAEVERELASIDAVMARRPALDKPTRWQNVEHACATAGREQDRANRLQHDLTAMTQERDNYRAAAVKIAEDLTAARARTEAVEAALRDLGDMMRGSSAARPHWLNRIDAALATPPATGHDAETELPYIKVIVTTTERGYNRAYGDDRLCVCGHVYYRHFDTYANHASIGCKYCDCHDFNEATGHDAGGEVGR